MVLWCLVTGKATTLAAVGAAKTVAARVERRRVDRSIDLVCLISIEDIRVVYIDFVSGHSSNSGWA